MSERDEVDAALDKAKEAARRADKEADAPMAGAWASLIVNCTEAIVRQVRDLDDDVYHLREALDQHGADLGVIINGLSDGLLAAAQRKR